MTKWIALVSLVLAIPALAATHWYGEKPNGNLTPVPVGELMQSLDHHLDQPLVLSGRITNVCTKRGCWAVFEDQGEILRVIARDHSFAMPEDMRGQAVAHGILEKVEISPDHARHLVEDDGADAAVLEQEFEYRLVANGVRLTP